MNTDRELLELAAKAAGLNVKAERVDADDKFTHLIVGAKNTRERIAWNPLTDDGDALRLAVKVGIIVATPAYNGGRQATASAAGGEGWSYCCYIRHTTEGGKQKADETPWMDETTGSHLEATRCAIVRAAAAIGRAMK